MDACAAAAAAAATTELATTTSNQSHATAAATSLAAVTAAVGAGAPAGAVPAVPFQTSLTKQIEELKAQQKTLRENRKRVASALKNSQKRKRRLVTKARMLSNDDLVQVLTMRASVNTSASASSSAPTASNSEDGDAMDEVAL